MTPPRRPQPPLVDDGYLVEPEPVDDRIPRLPPANPSLMGPGYPRKRRGCSVIPFLILAVLVGSSIAAPRSGQTTTVPPRDLSELRDDRSAGQSGAPHVHGGLHPGNGTQDGLASADRLFVPPTTVGAPQPTPALISEPPDRPYQSAIGTALFQASATWCGPNPRTGQCLRWGGRALLAALPTYSGRPYVVRVWRGSRHVDVLVVSICGCGIDLSPYAFEHLAPLSRGRIDVEVEGPIEPLPATDVVP